MTKCNNCGTLNAADSTVCTKCGASLEESKAVCICYKCGEENDGKASVCRKCGADISVGNTVKKCPNCGKIYPLNADECPECRYPLLVVEESEKERIDTKKEENEDLHTYITWWMWLIAVLFPIIGIIMGVLLISPNDPNTTYAGKKLIIFSLAMIAFVPLAVLVVLSLVKLFIWF